LPKPLPLPPALPQATTTLLAGQINAFVNASRTGGALLVTATNRLIGTMDTVITLWNSNGTIPYLQSVATPAAVAAFQFNDGTRAQLASSAATQGMNLPPVELVKTESEFPSLQPYIAAVSSAGGVNGNLVQGLAWLGKFATAESSGGGGVVSFHERGPGSGAPHIIRVGIPPFPNNFCYYALYAAVAGLFSALSWEVPPIAALFAGLAFVYTIAAMFMC
jgi:hypothetical protein